MQHKFRSGRKKPLSSSVRMIVYFDRQNGFVTSSQLMRARAYCHTMLLHHVGSGLARGDYDQAEEHSRRGGGRPGPSTRVG
eukprot:1136048-Pleurochrysis_carterae.AAC.1